MAIEKRCPRSCYGQHAWVCPGYRMEEWRRDRKRTVRGVIRGRRGRLGGRRRRRESRRGARRRFMIILLSKRGRRRRDC